ncbi:KH domain-containing protein HEN4-like [Ananas comosus]|uniref:KH domain-containing protein HEN4-like n=1 Tax=Ananas comosus TaxID=4615 RepID=A0A6P5F4F9_ANACO|nr:KH domain-containing protein HEN4-like [Ananas comosus]
MEGSAAAADHSAPSPTTPSASASSSGSKRPHPSSTAAAGGGGGGGFRVPAPQLPTASASETLFRIICPADRLGGVVAKDGSVLAELGAGAAAISVDNPVPRCDDRVVVIVGESHPRKDPAATADHEASPAQRALVRVYERIARGEEERMGGGDGGGGEGKEMMMQRLVVCRLLAPGGQVGCVLGKGGKIVEKIRLESGAQIRVFGKEHLPLCAAPSDELIQISGSFSSVKKALLSVSSCLQENPRSSITNFAFTKSAPMNPYGQRSFPPSSNVSHRKVIEEDVIFRMLCSSDKVGCIIGKAGAVVRALQNETGALIKVLDSVLDSDEKIITISARENSEMRHSPAQDAVMRVHTRLADAGIDKGPTVSARLLVPAQQIGCLMGKGGTIIAEMRKETGASIRIFFKEQIPKCAQPNDEVVQVTGNFQSVHDALLRITGRIRENIIPVRMDSMTGINQYSPRSRQEPTPSGRYSTPGLSLGSDPSIGISNSADQIPFYYGSQTAGSRPFVDRPSPRSWAPEVPSGGSLKGTPDMGEGFRGGTFGSGGSQINVQTSTKTEVIVPCQYLGFVCGENGNDLAEIKKMSGAMVTVHDAKLGETVGKVTICGTPDQTKMAQSLLHAFILCGLFPS